MKTINTIAMLAILALMLSLDGAYAEEICQYASSASATSEATNAMAIYATGIPNAPYVGNCGVWSGPDYNWNPTNWNIQANLTLRYDTIVNVYNITVFGDYDMCVSGIWVMDSSTGQKKPVSNSINTNCLSTYNAGANFSADGVIIQTCGWAWTSTDAVQMCGTLPTSPVCGDSILQPPEQCDLGALNGVDGSTCSSNCSIVIIPPMNLSVCGNGVLEQPPAFPNSTEVCDLGIENGQSNSTCSINCSIVVIEPPVNVSVCGNGILEQPPAYPNSTELCDLGALNGMNGSTCSSNCSIVVVPETNLSVCGNGILEQPPAYPNSTEICDLGALNGVDGSTCSSNCSIVVIEPPVNLSSCGNGILEQPPAYPNSTEICDLGELNGVDGSTCSSNCSIVIIPPVNLSICGNGVLEQPPAFPNSTEVCDDGNLINGDGCNSTCNVENVGNASGTLCQYAQNASATSEADTGKAIYAIGAPDAPYGGNCGVWSGPGYNWNPINWNVKANITLKYATSINPNNLTVFGDYDMCISGIWIMNSTTGQSQQILNGVTNACNATYDAISGIMADSIILQTCGWSWSAIDAVQMCGSRTNASTGPVCGNGKIESGEECDDGNKINGDGCSDACKIEAISGTTCSYAMNAEATSEQLGYEAIYAVGAPNSDDNCGTLASPKIAWQKSIWNVPSNITLTFPSMYASNLTVLGDYDLCINRVWLWRDDHWYLAQAGSIDKSIGVDCKIDYNYSNLDFKTTKVKLETCGWRVAAIDAAKLCGSSESYPKINLVSPTQDRIIDSSENYTTITIATDIPSKCEYHYERNFEIGDGINMSTTDGLMHKYTLAKPVKDSVEIYYRCVGNNGKVTPNNLMHRITFGKINSPFIEVCNWNNCSEGAASISIDDGYHPTIGKVAATCIDTLDKNNFKGTYFLAYTDKYNQSDWNIWKNASSKGHEIGGHSVSHVCDAEFPLNKTFYVNETQRNIADILKNVGIPGSALTTYAWQCGDYFPEYGGWIAPYYQFARGYNFDQTLPLESKNPQNFMNYKSANTLGFGDNPPDYNSLADIAQNYQDWVNYVYHDTCNNPESIDYLKTKNIWVDTIGTVSKYIKERESATMQNIVNTSTGVKFNLYTNLNQTIYNKNLTMRIYLGNGDVTGIKVNNVNVGFTRFSINGQPYVKFNVPPKRTNTIEISGLKVNVPYCSDRKVNQKSEECDDGNKLNGDGCSSTCKNEIKAYVIPYVGDIDGSVDPAWFAFYDKLWKWHNTTNVSVALSFYPRTIENNAQFNTILANMYLCDDCELVTKGEGINGTDLDNMTYEQVKALIGADQEYFRNKTQEALKAKNISVTVTAPRAYNQLYGMFTKTIRSAIHDLGFTMYLEQYITEEYGYTNSMPDFDITQYAVDFTRSGLPGYNETFKTQNETLQEILNFEDDHARYINGIKVVPLMAHQQDFMTSDTNMTVNATKWNTYTATLNALKKDKRFKLLKPQDVYKLRHP